MAKKKIRIRAKMKGDVTEVKALMSHPMETGLRKNKKTGEKIPAHFIREVTCEHKGKKVMVASWGVAVSKNPYLSFKFKGAGKGESITISWTDNKGESATADTKIG
ncbi:MAG: thiosulfate oxidation carrier complex protein SoxZ [Ectothiorhodospiraceae bacterium]|nr:thiosulfate oxidation carrier complex protein SoxZ [Ectothiorhodospiraceae bacterium]MBN4053024.1 thiosulfate oxidation carrier complex protein SoxZ [Gammaproteobacteria bacterium AH-315-K14]